MTWRIAAISATLFLIPALWAQDAEISGLVKDPSGAVVPNATVKIKNLATHLLRTTQTNGAGIYSVPALPPSRYEIEVSKAGFRTAVRSNVKLDVGERAQSDFSLRVGESTQTVTVSGENELLQSADATVATVIDSQFVANLPLNGRSLQTLINLAPGVVTTAASSQNPGQFSVNGQRSDTNYVTVDGVSANLGVNSFAGFSPAVSGSLPATGRCASGVQDPDLHVRSRVRPLAGRANLAGDALGRQSVPRLAIRILPQRQDGCERFFQQC